MTRTKGDVGKTKREVETARSRASTRRSNGVTIKHVIMSLSELQRKSIFSKKSRDALTIERPPSISALESKLSFKSLFVLFEIKINFILAAKIKLF